MAIKKKFKVRRKSVFRLSSVKINWKLFYKFVNNISWKMQEVYWHIGAHWPRYMLSLITATFTATAALTLTGEMYYALMAVLLAEGMWLYWLSRVEVFENKGQQFVSVLMFIVSSIAIIITDIASAVLLANKNDTLAFYDVVPEWVGYVVTNVTPILAASNLIAYGLFEFFSDTNRDKRESASRSRHMERVTKASKRDITKLNTRIQLLRIHRRLGQIQRRQEKVFGADLVASVNSIMKLELMQMKQDKFDFLVWLKSIISRVKTFREELFNDDNKKKK